MSIYPFRNDRLSINGFHLAIFAPDVQARTGPGKSSTRKGIDLTKKAPSIAQEAFLLINAKLNRGDGNRLFPTVDHIVGQIAKGLPLRPILKQGETLLGAFHQFAGPATGVTDTVIAFDEVYDIAEPLFR